LTCVNIYAGAIPFELESVDFHVVVARDWMSSVGGL